MTDSTWEALAEIYLRQSAPELADSNRENTFCLCSRVLVKNQTEAVAIEQEELSEAYDIFTDQYCENPVGTMNRKEHSQEEEDSDANSCYFSASASHTDNYCTTDDQHDSGADISEYHCVASTSRELFKRSHRDEGSKSSSTSVERDHSNNLLEMQEEKGINEQWEKFWSENCERLIWTSWIQNYSAYISPEYQNLATANDSESEPNKNDGDHLQSEPQNESEDSINEVTLTATANRGTEIIVSTCSDDATEMRTIKENIGDTSSRPDSHLRDLMDNLALPRCDSVTSSIPLTINTTDSMTNVTQITISSFGFCSSRITSSENSNLSESTPSSLSPPINFDEDEATKMELNEDGDSTDQQWQLLWQQHYQDQYNKNYADFMTERKQAKACTISREAKAIASEPLNTDDDDDELKKLAELGLPTSFGNKIQKSHTKHPIPRQVDEPNTDRVKAAFTLMGFSFQNSESPDTNGHVTYRKRNIRLHNNLLKMKKKRIDLDNSARDEALLNLIADSSSDETDKLLPTISLVKIDSPEQKDAAAQKDDAQNKAEGITDATTVIETQTVDKIETVISCNDASKDIESMAKKCDIGDEVENVLSSNIDDSMSGGGGGGGGSGSGAVTKSNIKKMKKKRRQNKMLSGLPAEIASDRTMYKYWCKRFSLFSLFDLGIKLDRESWFSVTPEKVAIYTAMRCQCDVIVDAFCGAGGNTIQFAKTCHRVIAIDIDAKKIEMAKHNASIYGVSERIDFIVGDYFQLAATLKADVVFLSPPWGGPQYLKADVYDIEKSLLPLPASELMAYSRKISPNIAIYLPRNTNTFQLAKLAGPGKSVEIEQGFLDRKLIAITAFYGNLLKKSPT